MSVSSHGILLEHYQDHPSNPLEERRRRGREEEEEKKRRRGREDEEEGKEKKVNVEPIVMFSILYWYRNILKVSFRDCFSFLFYFHSLSLSSKPPHL